MSSNTSSNTQLQQVSAWRSHDHSEPAHRLAAASNSVAPTQSPALLLAGHVSNVGKRLRMVFASPKAKRRLMSTEELYNQWLHDYIRQGGTPSDYYNSELPKEQFMRRVMDDGAVCVEYRAGRVGYIFKWDGSRALAVKSNIPVYTNTIDKSIIQENSSDGERLRRSQEAYRLAKQGMEYASEYGAYVRAKEGERLRLERRLAMHRRAR